MTDTPTGIELTLRCGEGAASAIREAVVGIDGGLPAAVAEQVAVLGSVFCTPKRREEAPADPLAARVGAVDGGVRVELRGQPLLLAPGGRETESSSLDGWRLGMLEHLADRWGVSSESGSLLVWFEIDASPPPLGAAAASGEDEAAGCLTP